MNDTEDDNEVIDFMVDEIEVELEKNPDHAIARIQGFYPRALNITKQAEAITVQDQGSSATALNIGADAKKLHAEIEAERKRLTAPFRDFIQKVNLAAKDIQQSLLLVDGIIKFKLAGYQLDQEIIAQKAQEAVKNLSETLGLDVTIIAPNAPKNLSSDKATTSTREKLTFEIEDANLIPDEYWVIDEKLIQKHIDLGKREIPGIKIKTEKTMIIRRK